MLHISIPHADAPGQEQPGNSLVLRCWQATELSAAYGAEARQSLAACKDLERPFLEEAAALFDRFGALGRRMSDLAEQATDQSLSPAK